VNQLKIDISFRYENVRLDPKYTINLQNDQLYLGSGIIIVYVIALCIAVIAFAIIIKQLKQYVTIYRMYSLKMLNEEVPSQLGNIFQQAKEKLEIKEPVKLICSRLCDSPMTIGIFKPTIVFPPTDKMNLCADDCKFILKHELLHIKNRDLFLKFLALFALALHWYNPICYFLYYELCAVSEMYCDYGVIKNADDSQRNQYSHLILNLAVAGTSKKMRFAVGLVSNGAASFKRRILEMKKARRRTKPILSRIMMFLICIAATITAFAYEAPHKHMLINFGGESERIFSASVDAERNEKFVFDHFFTDEECHVIPLNNPSQSLQCNHIYVKGTITDHIRKSNGDCIITVRSALCCKHCLFTVEGGVISKTEFTVCPH